MPSFSPRDLAFPTSAAPAFGPSPVVASVLSLLFFYDRGLAHQIFSSFGQRTPFCPVNIFCRFGLPRFRGFLPHANVAWTLIALQPDLTGARWLRRFSQFFCSPFPPSAPCPFSPPRPAVGRSITGPLTRQTHGVTCFVFVGGFSPNTASPSHVFLF